MSNGYWLTSISWPALLWCMVGIESPMQGERARPPGPCRIEGKPLAQASQWLERYRRIWEGNFQRLDALLDELQAPAKKRRHGQRQ